MDSIGIEDVEYRTLQLLHDTGERELPIEVFNVAHHLGIQVLGARFTDPRMSGAVQKTADGGRIWVNRLASTIRQQFIMAHEIGHWVLHMHVGDQWSEPDAFIDVELKHWRDHQDFRSMESEEQVANAFAAALLMPWPLLDAQRLRHPRITIPDLAEICEVSELAMEARWNQVQRVS